MIYNRKKISSFIVASLLVLALSACGQTRTERVVTGAGIGAGAGAVGGLATGYDPVTGAVVGGAVGAGVGAVR